MLQYYGNYACWNDELDTAKAVVYDANEGGLAS